MKNYCADAHLVDQQAVAMVDQRYITVESELYGTAKVSFVS